ncbi:MAG: hypothetical protein JXA90_00850, partial [Planctomycetes bacterium]|nr:hypothetical protein [Planctomycetota bacterium]
MNESRNVSRSIGQRLPALGGWGSGSALALLLCAGLALWSCSSTDEPAAGAQDASAAAGAPAAEQTAPVVAEPSLAEAGRVGEPAAAVPIAAAEQPAALVEPRAPAIEARSEDARDLLLAIAGGSSPGGRVGVQALLGETAALVRGESPPASGEEAENLDRAKGLLAQMDAPPPAAPVEAAPAVLPPPPAAPVEAAPAVPPPPPAAPAAVSQEVPPPPAAPAAVAAAPAGSEAPPAAAEQPLPAAKPEEPPAPDPAPAPAPAFTRAGEFSFPTTLFHKTASEVFDYVKQIYPEWIEKGHIYKMPGKGRTVLVFTEKPMPEDPVGQKIVQTIEAFDGMDLKIERKIIRPRYIELQPLMDTMVMAGLANIYELTTAQDALTWKQDNKQRTLTRTVNSYVQAGASQDGGPISVPDKIPYVYQIASADPFTPPVNYTGQNQQDRVLMNFTNSSSTEERGGMMAVGTAEDIERIQAFVDSVDVPAQQVMIEVQVVELDANKLTDFGFDSLQFGSGHHIGTFSLPLPGEQIVQPGLGEDVRRDPEQFVPMVTSEGFDFIFDDTTYDLSGRFLTRLHALVREGDAQIRARPKILTLDDRTSVLHIGREEPVFASTGITTDATNGNLVTRFQQIDHQYVGFTLNIRPRVTGGAEDEVALQIEILVNEIDGRRRVYEEDLSGVPSVIKRHFIGQNVVKNHRPMILGGLIQEQESESSNKVPILGDIPYLGWLFRRTQKTAARSEIILIVTPHILHQKGFDRLAAPKESSHFDTFDSVLFNDRHIIKGSDVIGIDPVNRVPAQGPDGRVFTEEEVVDLTLLNIVKKRRLISKLDVLNSYIPSEAEKLWWWQRNWPEYWVSKSWSESEQEVFFRAAAILIENVKELNEGLTFDDIVVPRREIVLPTSPYRITLSYDKVKALQTLGAQYLRSGRVDLDQGAIDLVKQAGGRNLRNFADFLERKKRGAEDHGNLLIELKKLYTGLYPESNALEGIAYADVYRELQRANIDFTAIATYLQTSFDKEYVVSGAPDVGLFPADLSGFLESTLTLTQRGRRLKELDQKWRQMSTAEDEEE